MSSMDARTGWTALAGVVIAFALTLVVLAFPLLGARTAEGPATAISIYGP